MAEIADLYEKFKKAPRIYIDNRKIDGSGLFFGLKGDRQDGNTYAQKAIEAGATYAIVDDERYQFGPQYILVEDSLKMLQKLARYHRKQMDIPVIAITGTNGKTTTKELTTRVLAKKYITHSTPGNYNNHLGLPLTILSCPVETEIMIVEMGASKKGDILELCEIGQPTIGLITNIGRAHLAGFGHSDHIYETKKELYDYINRSGGQFFICSDEPSLHKISNSSTDLIVYGSSQSANYIMTSSLDGPTATVEGCYDGMIYTISSNLFGRYNGLNMSAAIAIGLYFELGIEYIQEAIESYRPDNNRSQIMRRGELSILLDSYNANPTSMLKTIEAFAQFEAPAKSLIIGDMLELGEYAADEHQNIVNAIKKYDWSKVILVGKHFVKTTNHGYECKPSVDSVNLSSVPEGWVLIKGSRGLALEKLVCDTDV